MSNSVDHPTHYNVGSIEVIDAIEAWALGFHLGNVVKYVARAPHKGCELIDLRKAAWYLERFITRTRHVKTRAEPRWRTWRGSIDPVVAARDWRLPDTYAWVISACARRIDLPCALDTLQRIIVTQEVPSDGE